MKPLSLIVLPALISLASADPTGSVSFTAKPGPGAGKKVVLIAGDEEYRSEESMPMFAKVLAEHQGFNTTVLFSVGADGNIDPNAQGSITNPEALDSADAIVMLVRFRKWSDDAMKHFDDAVKRGVPIVGLRTATHSFQQPGTSAYKNYNSFGKNILGETWVSHWGSHMHEATRGIIEAANAKNPVLNGVTDIFGDTDVYEAHPPADATILVRGQVLKGMGHDDVPADYSKKTSTGTEQKVNEPMMPIAWTREVKSEAGTTNRVLCTTMGAATDLNNEGLRRLVVNGVFWGLKLPVPEKADVTPVGKFETPPYGNNRFRKDVTPASHALTAAK